MQLKKKREIYSNVGIAHNMTEYKHFLEEFSLNVCCVAVGTRAVAVLVHQSRDEVWRYANDQAVRYDS